MSNRAWVTLATNDSYSLGALVLAHSLRRAGSLYPAAVLITPSVTDAMRERLRAVFAEVVTVDVLDSRDAAHLALLQRPELGITFTKIHCWNLTHYEKCVFLDADTLVVQNCDELFEREELSAAPDVGWPDCFNSGVFVFKPSQATFDALIKLAEERGSFDGGDQGLLNSYFSDWAQGDINKHLPFLYNVTSAAFYSYLPALKHYGQNLKIVHFIGAAKPWLQKFNWESRSVDAPEHLREFLQLWWDLFVGQVHIHLDVTMGEVNEAPPVLPPHDVSQHYMPVIDPESEFPWHRPNAQRQEDTQRPDMDMSQFHDPWEIYRGHIPPYRDDKPTNHSLSGRVEDHEEMKKYAWEYQPTHHHVPYYQESTTHQSHEQDQMHHHANNSHQHSYGIHHQTDNWGGQSHQNWESHSQFNRESHSQNNWEGHSQHNWEGHSQHNVDSHPQQKWESQSQQIWEPNPQHHWEAHSHQSGHCQSEHNWDSHSKHDQEHESSHNHIQHGREHWHQDNHNQDHHHLEHHSTQDHNENKSENIRFENNQHIHQQIVLHSHNMHDHQLHNHASIQHETHNNSNYNQAEHSTSRMFINNTNNPIRVARVSNIHVTPLDHRHQNSNHENSPGEQVEMNGYISDTEIDQEDIIPRHPYDGYYLRHRAVINSHGHKICTHEIPATPTPSPSPPPEVLDVPIFLCAEELFVINGHDEADEEDQSGVAGNLARVVPGASSSQRDALDELTRRQGWEAGNIDYLGADSFENIWARISQTLSQPRTSPPKQLTPSPKEISPVKEPSPANAAQETPVVDSPVAETAAATEAADSLPPLVDSLSIVEAPKTVATPATIEVPLTVEAPVSTEAPAPVQAPIALEAPPVVEASAVAEAPVKDVAPPADVAPLPEVPIEIPVTVKATAEIPASEIPVTVEAAVSVPSVEPVVQAPAVTTAVIPTSVEEASTPGEAPVEEAPVPVPLAATPEKVSQLVPADSPPLANTPSKEQPPALPDAKSEERRKGAGKLQLKPPTVADPLPTPDSEMEDAATLATSIIASELRTPTVTSPGSDAPPTSPLAAAHPHRLSVDEPEVPTPPVDAGTVSLSQIGIKPVTKPKTSIAAQIESSLTEKTPEAAAADPPKKKIVKKVVKKETATGAEAPVPPPRKKEKKPKEK